jgi:Domain of unknown function (DUF1931)
MSSMRLRLRGSIGRPVAAEDTQQRLPDLGGGLSIALARALKTIARDTRRPTTDRWDEAFELFDLLI